jgi:hypothetical protein
MADQVRHDAKVGINAAWYKPGNSSREFRQSRGAFRNCIANGMGLVRLAASAVHPSPGGWVKYFK